MHNRELHIDENTLMAFEICGEIYKLSDYDTALNNNKDKLIEYYPFLEEFPYTIRKVKGDALETIRNVPVNILYNGKNNSLYDFIKENQVFEAKLPQVDEINSLECIHELGVVFKQLEKRDQYHAVIIETFRVLHDLSFSLNTARYALMQAHRILHFTSELKWSTGWEQLWNRAVWLNNAIVMYNSCFDKLIQAVWIGFKSFDGYQKVDKEGKPKGPKLSPRDLYTPNGLNRIFMFCDYNTIKGRFPIDVNAIIYSKYSTDLKKVREYANRIKHRGGMRYKGLFPYGSIGMMNNEDCYSSSRTQIEDDMDKVINDVKDYHIVFCKLVKDVFKCLMEEFQKHDYLTENTNKVVLSVQKCKTKFGVYKLGPNGKKIKI